MVVRGRPLGWPLSRHPCTGDDCMFDWVGTLVLLVIIVLVGFLTTRAWRLKNGFLKWGGSALGALLTLIPTAVLALALAGFAKLNQHYTNPAADVQVARTPA